METLLASARSLVNRSMLMEQLLNVCLTGTVLRGKNEVIAIRIVIFSTFDSYYPIVLGMSTDIFTYTCTYLIFLRFKAEFRFLSSPIPILYFNFRF
jgi:hypothetical protein